MLPKKYFTKDKELMVAISELPSTVDKFHLRAVMVGVVAQVAASLSSLLSEITRLVKDLLRVASFNTEALF